MAKSFCKDESVGEEEYDEDINQGESTPETSMSELQRLTYLRDTYQLIWAAVSIVAAVILSMLVSANGSYQFKIADGNIWKTVHAENVAMDLYHFCLGVCMILSTFSILWCISLLAQFAQVPKAKTRELLEDIGEWSMEVPSGVLLVGIVMTLTCAISIQFTLVFSTHWVSIALIACQGAMVALFVFAFGFQILSTNRRVILGIQDGSRLIWAAIAIVSAVFLSMLVSTDGNYDLTAANRNIWKSIQAENIALDVYHFCLGVCMILSTFSILWCISLLAQLARTPRSKTRTLPVELADWVVKAPSGIFLVGTVMMLTFALTIQFSLVFSSRWVSVALLSCQGALVVLFVCGIHEVATRKRIILGRTMANRQIEEQQTEDDDEQETWLTRTLDTVVKCC